MPRCPLLRDRDAIPPPLSKLRATGRHHRMPLRRCGRIPRLAVTWIARRDWQRSVARHRGGTKFCLQKGPQNIPTCRSPPARHLGRPNARPGPAGPPSAPAVAPLARGPTPAAPLIFCLLRSSVRSSWQFSCQTIRPGIRVRKRLDLRFFSIYRILTIDIVRDTRWR
jgi:hypothetical protein